MLGLLVAKAFCCLEFARYSHAVLSMDDALVRCCLDVSGRGRLFWSNSECRLAAAGELVRTVLDSAARNANLSLHVDILKGSSSHHVCEAVFKAFGVCCRRAFEAASCSSSTKGIPLII